MLEGGEGMGGGCEREGVRWRGCKEVVKGKVVECEREGVRGRGCEKEVVRGV